MTEKRLLPGKSTSFFRKNIWKKNGVSVLLAIFLKNCSNLLDVGRPWRPNHSLIWETFLTPGTKLDTGMRRWIRWSCLWGALSNLSKKGINIYLNNVIFIHLNLKRGMCVYTQTHIHTYWLLLREMTSVKANWVSGRIAGQLAFFRCLKGESWLVNFSPSIQKTQYIPCRF